MICLKVMILENPFINKNLSINQFIRKWPLFSNVKRNIITAKKLLNNYQN